MKTKYLQILGMMFFMPIFSTKMLGQKFYSSEIKKPKIEKRTEWDKNLSLLAQYSTTKQIGSVVKIKIFDKIRLRKIKEICYVKPDCDTTCILRNTLKSITIHQTSFEYSGTPTEQVKFICEGQILDHNYMFSDIAYHFVITSDGSIFEGRPLTHMGTHAGKIIENNIYLDPDYGSIGIVLLGSFDKIEPYECQIESLIALLNWLKFEYWIPNSKIYYHREIKCLVESLGLHSKSKDKTCPGTKFPDKNFILTKLIPDLNESNTIETKFKE